MTAYTTLRQAAGRHGVWAASGPAATRRPGHYWLFVLLMVFLVVLPKGGIALGSSPLTFGYLLLAALAPIALIGLVMRRNFSPLPLINLLVGYVPIALFAAYKIMAEGTLFALVVYATVFAVLPIIMLLAYSPYLEDFTDEEIGVCLTWCIRIVVLWGIFNFFMYAFFKQIVEIPYLTINVADIGAIFFKNNRRGSLMKLVSSYNNGNLYGACMAMLAPIYFYFEKSRVFIAAFCLAMVLTLSRTAWAALICIFCSLALIGQIKLTRGYIWVGGVVMLAIVIAVLPFMGWSADRVVDANLGGRLVQWQDLQPTLFGADNVRVSEILYAGLLQSFGVIGGTVAIIALAFPVGYGLFAYQRLSLLQRSALVGMIMYLLVAFVDAAFIYPPTIVQYLFLAAMVFRRGGRDAAPVVSPPRDSLRRGPLTLAQAAANVR